MRGQDHWERTWGIGNFMGRHRDRLGSVSAPEDVLADLPPHSPRLLDFTSDCSVPSEVLQINVSPTAVPWS